MAPLKALFSLLLDHKRRIVWQYRDMSPGKVGWKEWIVPLSWAATLQGPFILGWWVFDWSRSMRPTTSRMPTTEWERQLECQSNQKWGPHFFFSHWLKPPDHLFDHTLSAKLLNCIICLTLQGLYSFCFVFFLLGMNLSPQTSWLVAVVTG